MGCTVDQGACKEVLAQCKAALAQCKVLLLPCRVPVLLVDLEVLQTCHLEALEVGQVVCSHLLGNLHQPLEEMEEACNVEALI